MRPAGGCVVGTVDFPRYSLPTTTPSDAPVTDRVAERSGPAAPRWIAAFAGAWLLPLATHLVGADWLLPPVVLLGAMSLQRAGRTLLDRLVLAVAQLFGAFCVAGFLLSVWPWHLHPVPITGCALTALVALAALTGRRPGLPGRLPPGDLVVWLAALVVALLAYVPFALRSIGARIGIVATGEDMARHFVLFDMIGKIGGYAFLRSSPPPGYGSGMKNYPQGAHLLYAVLDRFVRSSNQNADGVTAMDILLWCHFGTYVFFALAVLWATRRVSGPGPTAATLLPVLAGVAGVLYFGDLFTLFQRGYPNELLGLALVAILTALIARPLRGLREQLVTVVALLVGISFTYHLFLPYAMGVAAIWAWSARRALRRHPRLFAGACLFLPLTLITPLANKPSSTGNLLLTHGTAFAADRPVIGVMLVAVLAGLFARGGWRSPARRSLAAEVAVALVLTALLLVYQYAMVGHSVYYFEKLVHNLIVVLLVGLGSAARLLPRVRLSGAGTLRRLVPGLAGAAVVILFLAGLGGRWHDQLLGSHGVRYAVGKERGSPGGGRTAVEVTRRYPDGGGRVNVVLASTPYANFYGTLFAAAMQRDYQYGEGWYVFLAPTGPAHTLADLEDKVRSSPVPVRLLVGDPHASFLVVDRDHPRRPTPGPGVSPAAYGDPDALTDIEAAEYLARQYPGRVEVVKLTS
jgi:hypothetical protein